MDNYDLWDFLLKYDSDQLIEKLDIGKLVGKTIKGSELNGIELYRITYREEKYDDIQLNDGWNEECDNGIYFCQLDDIFDWIKYIDYKKYVEENMEKKYWKKRYWSKKHWIRKVILDNNEDIYVDHNKLRAKKIFLEPRILFDDFLISKTEFCKKKLYSDSSLIRFFPKEIEGYYALCVHLVTLNGILLEYIPEDTMDTNICSIAVRGNDGVLSLVPTNLEEYEDICLEAVKENGLALGFIPKKMRNREMCLEAVKQNELAFEFVPKNIQKYVKKRIYL